MWGPADKEPEFEIRRFGTMTRDLQKLAEALVNKVVFEGRLIESPQSELETWH